MITQTIEAKTVAGVVSASQSQATNLVASQVLASVRATGTASDATAEEPASKELVSTDQDGKSLKITYNGTLTENDSLKFAVWSDENGQDDLIWYDADAKNAAYIDLSKRHKEYGLYNIHTYTFDKKTGAAHGLNARTYEVEPSSIITRVQKSENDTIEVTVANVSSDITGISLPTWSDVNGKDDIIWHSAQKVSDHTYKAVIKLSDHHDDASHIVFMSMGIARLLDKQLVWQLQLATIIPK